VTWLYNNVPSATLGIPGYNMFKRDREGAKGDGVMIYIKSIFSVRKFSGSTEFITTNIFYNHCGTPPIKIRKIIERYQHKLGQIM